MAGFDRYAAVLRLFSVEAPTWSVPAMADALESPASSLYRTVRELMRAGMVAQAGEARYRLGAAFVAFDRLARLSDPLVQHGAGVLADIVVQARLPCVGLIARVYNTTVMCVADATTMPAGFSSSYERGRPMPLTAGATSKAILAHLPARRLQALLASETGLPPDFRARLAEIRRQGFAVSRGEIDPGLVGLAVPVAAPGLLASLSLLVREDDLATREEPRLVRVLLAAAAMLADRLTQQP